MDTGQCTCMTNTGIQGILRGLHGLQLWLTADLDTMYPRSNNMNLIVGNDRYNYRK